MSVEKEGSFREKYSYYILMKFLILFLCNKVVRTFNQKLFFFFDFNILTRLSIKLSRLIVL